LPCRITLSTRHGKGADARFAGRSAWGRLRWEVRVVPLGKGWAAVAAGRPASGL